MTQSVYSDYEWFLREDLSRYSGKWVAIINRSVVGSDNDFHKLLQETRKKYPRGKPLITKVRTKLSIM